MASTSTPNSSGSGCRPGGCGWQALPTAAATTSRDWSPAARCATWTATPATHASWSTPVCGCPTRPAAGRSMTSTSTSRSTASCRASARRQARKGPKPDGTCHRRDMANGDAVGMANRWRARGPARACARPPSRPVLYHHHHHRSRARARADAMTRAAELLDACDRGDEVALDALGWRPVREALHIWARRLTWEDLKPYAIALGDEDPDQIAQAIFTLRGSEYRPSASQVFVTMHVATEPAHPRELRGRPDLAASALQAVRLAAAAGEPICDCHPRSPQMTIDRDGVLRCPDCGGLEVGQYETALEDSAQTPESTT